jgi:hypothetical protein
MQDLVEAGATFLDPLVGYGADQAARTLDQLARLHAATWSQEDAELAATFPPRLASLAGLMDVGQLQAQFDDGRTAGVPSHTCRADRLLAAMTALDGLGLDQPLCLVHGDLHAGNIYQLADGSPGLIDWQVAQRGVWALDVGYHFSTVLDPDDRARNERDLLTTTSNGWRLMGASRPPPATPGGRTGRTCRTATSFGPSPGWWTGPSSSISPGACGELWPSTTASTCSACEADSGQ